jgi:hypothetical protein
MLVTLIRNILLPQWLDGWLLDARSVIIAHANEDVREVNERRHSIDGLADPVRMLRTNRLVQVGVQRRASRQEKQESRAQRDSEALSEHLDALADALGWRLEPGGDDIVEIDDDEPENEYEERMLVPFSGSAPSSSSGWGNLNVDELLAREEEEERICQRHLGDPADAGPERAFLVGVGKKGSPEDGDLELDIGPLFLSLNLLTSRYITRSHLLSPSFSLPNLRGLARRTRQAR